MTEFSLNIQKHIKTGLVVSGKFDGSHACLAAATPGGTILVHSPHRQPQIDFSDHKQSSKRLLWSGELAELQIGTEVVEWQCYQFLFYIHTSHTFEEKRTTLHNFVLFL